MGKIFPSSFFLTYGACSSSEWLEEQEALVTHKNSCHILTTLNTVKENQIERCLWKAFLPPAEEEELEEEEVRL